MEQQLKDLESKIREMLSVVDALDRQARRLGNVASLVNTFNGLNAAFHALNELCHD